MSTSTIRLSAASGSRPDVETGTGITGIANAGPDTIQYRRVDHPWALDSPSLAAGESVTVTGHHVIGRTVGGNGALILLTEQAPEHDPESP